MIPFTYAALEVVDSAGTVTSVADLTDGTQYSLVSYAPTIAPMRPSAIVGGGDYADVDDTIVVHVLGATAALCVANYEALIGLIDQAARWWAGETVGAVQLAIEVQCSTIGKLSALILGAPAGQPPAQANPEPDVTVAGWIIRDVQLRLVRRGLWLRPLGAGAGDDIGSVAGVANPGPASLTFSGGDHNQPSPLAIGLENTSATFAAGTFVLWADTANEASGGLKVDIATMAGATAAGFANQADAANLPFGGNNVLRYTPASTAFATSGAPTFSTAFNLLAGTVAIFAAVRNNSTAVSWLIRAVANLSGTLFTPAAPVRTRPVVVDTSSQLPRIIPLGVLSAGSFILPLQLEVAAESLVGSPTLDISYIAVVAINEPGSGVVQIDATLQATDERQIISAALANLPQPAVVNRGTVPSDTIAQIPYSGNAEAQATNAGVRVAILGTNSTFWRITTGGAAHQFTIRGTRRRAYRTPQ